MSLKAAIGLGGVGSICTTFVPTFPLNPPYFWYGHQRCQIKLPWRLDSVCRPSTSHPVIDYILLWRVYTFIVKFILMNSQQTWNQEGILWVTSDVLSSYLQLLFKKIPPKYKNLSVLMIVWPLVSKGPVLTNFPVLIHPCQNEGQ